MDLFNYAEINNQSKKTLFLLHGTGGNERDFLFLDTLLEKRYNLVGLRGNIDEHGQPRFFKRKEVGMFDQESIKEETAKLKQFLDAFGKTRTITPEDSMFFGYSNGANMILATMFYYPEVIQCFTILHPMIPFTPDTDLSRHAGFVSYGSHDPLVRAEESYRLIAILKSRGANIEEHEYQGGHGISQQEMNDAVEYMSRNQLVAGSL